MVPDYEEALTKHLQKLQRRFTLHLGKKLGNILRVPLEKSQLQIDLLVAGPPCPPWAGQGNKMSTADPRAKVFMKVVEWIIFFAKCAGLLLVIIENVVGINQVIGGNEPAIEKFLRILRTHVPEFTWAVDVATATDYLCPQTRTRVFLRGLRTCVASEVPSPLPAFGHRSLVDALGRFPHTPRSEFTMQQRTNIKTYEAKIRELYAAGKLNKDDLLIASIDRSEGRTYKAVMKHQHCAHTHNTR